MKYTSANNNKEQVNINTRFMQFMNAEAETPSTMQLSYWNDMLSIKINPALPPEKRTQNSFYNYEEGITTALTVEKVLTLVNEIKREIIPAIKAGTNRVIGIPIAGGTSLLTVSTGVKRFGEVRPFVTIFKNLNPETKRPEQQLSYEFINGLVVNDYDETTGSFTTDSVQSDLLLFVTCLENSIIGLTSSVAHSNRYHDRFFRNSISGGNGMTSGNGGYRKNTNVFGNNNSSELSNDFGEVDQTKLNNMDDIDSFMS